MFHYVYQITNNINGKKYIGKHSSKTLDNNYYGSGSLIKKAIKKYGKENFSKEVIKILETSEEAYRYEENLILEKLVSKDPMYYNISMQGSGGRHGNSLSEEHKRKISLKITGRKHTDEAKRKIGDSKRGKSNWHKGQKRSDESRKKLSIAKTGVKLTEEHKKNISKVNMGDKNPNFGKMWITDKILNKKINKTDPIPDGWTKGRSFKKGYYKKCLERTPS